MSFSALKLHDSAYTQLNVRLLLFSFAGQVGFVACGIRNSKDAQIGDTFFHPNAPVEPLAGFKPMRPMVSHV